MKKFNRFMTLTTVAVAFIALSNSVVSAATQTSTLSNCQSALNGQTIEVAQGDDLSITFTSCPAAVTSALFLGSVTPVSTAISVAINGATFTRAFDGGKWRINGYGSSGIGQPLPVGSYEIFFRVYDDFNNVELYVGSFNVSVTSQTSQSPPVLQQFGKPEVGSCDSAQPGNLDWSGVSSGGWSESWAQWMNGGNGGAVCTRTLVYSTSQSRWVVG